MALDNSLFYLLKEDYKPFLFSSVYKVAPLFSVKSGSKFRSRLYLDVGFRVSGLGFRVWGLGFCGGSSGIWVHKLGIWVQDVNAHRFLSNLLTAACTQPSVTSKPSAGQPDQSEAVQEVGGVSPERTRSKQNVGFWV